MPAAYGRGISRTSTEPDAIPFTSGQYYFAGTPYLTSAGAATLNQVRVHPYRFRVPVSISKLGAEVTATGGAGSVFRIGVWADHASGGYPDALLLDAGTIDGTSVTVQDITLGSALVLQPGLYWFGGAGQVAGGPTMRVFNNHTEPNAIMRAGTSTPSAATKVSGYTQAGVTGAFGANFTSSLTVMADASAFRIHFKVS